MDKFLMLPFFSVAAQLPRNKNQFDKLVAKLMADAAFEYKTPFEKMVAEIEAIKIVKNLIKSTQIYKVQCQLKFLNRINTICNRRY